VKGRRGEVKENHGGILSFKINLEKEPACFQHRREDTHREKGAGRHEKKRREKRRKCLPVQERYDPRCNRKEKRGK